MESGGAGAALVGADPPDRVPRRAVTAVQPRFDAVVHAPPRLQICGLLAAVGSAEDAAATVRRYSEAGASSPCLGAIPKTDFDITLEALAGCLAPTS